LNTSMNRAESLKCKAIRGLGPDIADSDRLPVSLADHGASCLRCQAEVARYRKLRRELGHLAEDAIAAPERVAAAVELAVAAMPQTEPAKPTAKVVATAAGAAAAAASVVAVALWRRSRAVA